jgi:hypothetical protein
VTLLSDGTVRGMVGRRNVAACSGYGPAIASFGSRLARPSLTVCGMSEQAHPVLPPAGWYPNPEVVGVQRYWDGQRWTDHAAPGQSVISDKSAWVTIGWICAFMFPLVGFVIGFCLPRRYSQQGLWIMGASAAVGFIFLALYPH